MILGANRPLRLAVVGHTNTGKTSLLRTLTRNPKFGEVTNSPGTTRHVEGVRLSIDSNTIIELYDTPGLEDSVALLDYIENELTKDGERLDGPDQIQRLLESPESTGKFEQEARVLRALLECDAGLYVIDSRDPVLAKHKDELNLLSRCGHPIMPVLNFTDVAEHRIEEWRSAMARIGLHVSVEFDTVAPAIDGESSLYDRLSMLISQHAALLQRVKNSIIKQRNQRLQSAYKLISELIVDVAAWRTLAPADTESITTVTIYLRNAVRQHEQRCVQSLLQLYNFDSNTFLAHQLPLKGERWEMDLFSSQALKEMGIHVSKGVAAGAMAGATLDAIALGTSLGAGTVIGAAAGGLWQSADKWGKRIYSRMRGFQEISVDNSVIRLLLVRQMALLNALDQRGHAAQQPIVLATDDSEVIDSISNNEAVEMDFRTANLPETISTARANPNWSALSDEYSPSGRRQDAINNLANVLGVSVPSADNHHADHNNINNPMHDESASENDLNLNQQ